MKGFCWQAFDGVLSLLKHTQKPLLNRSMSDPSICHDGDETSVLSKYYISCSCFVQTPRHTREPMPFWHQRCQHNTKIQLLSPGELLYSLNTPWAPVIICNLCWRSLLGLSSLSLRRSKSFERVTRDARALISALLLIKVHQLTNKHLALTSEWRQKRLSKHGLKPPAHFTSIH